MLASAAHLRAVPPLLCISQPCLLAGARTCQSVVRTSRCTPTRMQYSERATSFTPLFSIIVVAQSAFVYETLNSAAAEMPAGMSAYRVSTLAQAHAFGKKVEAANPAISYNIFKMGEGTMELKGSYPKRVNAEGARVQFRRRTPRTGGANDETVLGVGGMGDDIWRELIERESWGSIDEAWREFRKQLELGREIEVVDERGDRIDFGAEFDDDEPEYD